MIQTPIRYLLCAHAIALAVLFTGCTSDPEPAIQDLPATEIGSRLEGDQDIVVLDIRTPEEFAAGHLAGARNIDFNGPDFEEKLGELDRTTTYVVHCRSGGRSGRSLDTFRDLGFRSILHMEDGFLAWEAAGREVVK